MDKPFFYLPIQQMQLRLSHMWEEMDAGAEAGAFHRNTQQRTFLKRDLSNQRG